MKKFLKNFEKYLQENNLDREYKILGTDHVAVKLRHSCGFEFQVRPHDFMYKNMRCFNCEINSINKDFTAEFESKKNNKADYVIRHSVCNKTFLLSRKRFELYGINCCHCNSLRSKKHYDYATVKSEIESTTNNEYELLSKTYTNCDEKLDILHKNCGNIMHISASHFLRDGRRCKQCSLQKNKRNSDDVKNDILSLTNGKIKILSDYEGWNIPMKFQHNTEKCQAIFERTAKDMIGNCIASGKEFCPYCSYSSNGEGKIKELLELHNVKFLYNKSIKGCTYIKPLKFDFIILNDDSIKSVIEFDGQQHFNSRNNFGSSENTLELIQERDKIKDIFCEKENIKLLRIKYTEFLDIEDILKENNII